MCDLCRRYLVWFTKEADKAYRSWAASFQTYQITEKVCYTLCLPEYISSKMYLKLIFLFKTSPNNKISFWESQLSQRRKKIHMVFR